MDEEEDRLVVVVVVVAGECTRGGADGALVCSRGTVRNGSRCAAVAVESIVSASLDFSRSLSRPTASSLLALLSHDSIRLGGRATTAAAAAAAVLSQCPPSSHWFTAADVERKGRAVWDTDGSSEYADKARIGGKERSGAVIPRAPWRVVWGRETEGFDDTHPPNFTVAGAVVPVEVPKSLCCAGVTTLLAERGEPAETHRRLGTTCSSAAAAVQPAGTALRAFAALRGCVVGLLRTLPTLSSRPKNLVLSFSIGGVDGVAVRSLRCRAAALSAASAATTAAEAVPAL